MNQNGKTKRIQRLVLEYLSRQNEARTGTEIFEALWLPRLSVLPNLCRMRGDHDKRWILLAGKRVNSISGREQIAYIISGKGMRYLETLSKHDVVC